MPLAHIKSSQSVLRAGTQNDMQYDCIAKAILTDGDGNILLLKRSTSDVRRPNQWDFPGGHVDDGEQPAEAVIREIKEESGLEATMKRLVFAKTEVVIWEEDALHKHKTNATWQYFICFTKDKNVVVSHEHSEYRWVSLSEALEIVEYHRHLEVLRHVRDNQLEI
mgnify:CR=1 FL=1